MNKLKVICPSRLLTFTKEHFNFSTKDLRWSIEHGRCLVNGRIERFTSTALQKGDEVVCWPCQRPFFRREEERILYEDADLLFYNKPPYIDSPHLAKILGVHLVHRLDRDTTGVILFAKRDPAPYETLFRERMIKKTYHALVKGVLRDNKGSFSGNMRAIGRREGAVIWGMSPTGAWSHTDWVREGVSNRASLLRCSPITGRTHQVRVHLRALGHPILGDCEYGDRHSEIKGLFRPLLHASSLALDSLSVAAPLPADFLHWKEQLHIFS